MAQPKDIKTKFLKLIDQVNAKNPYYLVVGVLVLVLLLDYFLVMQFQLGALRTLGPKVMQVSSDIERFEQNKGRVGKYKENIQDLDQKLAGLQNRIQDVENISGVLEDISRSANEHKIFVDQILPNRDLGDPVLENEQGRYFLLPVMIDARSSYHNFGRFLNDLEERGTLMKINKLRVSENPKDERLHLVQLLIEAVIFEPKENRKK